MKNRNFVLSIIVVFTLSSCFGTTKEVDTTTSDFQEYNESQIKEIRDNYTYDIAEQSLHEKKHNEKIIGVVLKNGERIVFDEQSASYDAAKDLMLGNVDSKHVSIPMENVSAVQIREMDKAKMTVKVILYIFGAFGTIMAILLATKQSCPFIYSYNGKKFVFDAEPLGGAITKILQKTDLSLLEHIKSKDGKYTILIRNEVPETQYIDQMKLLVVDHDPSVIVIPHINGDLVSVTNPQSPNKVIDDAGQDVTKFFQANDGAPWQTQVTEVKVAQKTKKLRHNLTFEFNKPKNVKNARLIFNIGTASWGSNMIRKMLELRGKKVDQWYQQVNQGGDKLEELVDFIEREELYLLKVHLLENGSWVQKALLPGSGPLITETRIADLDISNVKGDTVKIRMNPPWGYWQMDYIALDYGKSEIVQSVEINPKFTNKDKGNANIFFHIDGDSQIMRNVGDEFKLEFTAPKLLAGIQRTIYLKTHGFYELHLKKEGPEQTQLINNLLHSPGKIVEYSMQRFSQWQALQAMNQ